MIAGALQLSKCKVAMSDVHQPNFFREVWVKPRISFGMSKSDSPHPEPSYFSEKPKLRALASPAFLYNALGNYPASSHASLSGAISFSQKRMICSPRPSSSGVYIGLCRIMIISPHLFYIKILNKSQQIAQAKN